MRKTTAVFLVLSLLWLSGSLYAEVKGAEIVIQKKGGQQIKGELIAAKKDSLLLMEEKSGADITVGVEDIEVISIVKKSKVGMGALFGLLAGVAVGGVIYASSDQDEMLDMSGAIYGAGALVLGLATGTLFGIQAGVDKKYLIDGKSDSEIRGILQELRTKARITDFQ